MKHFMIELDDFRNKEKNLRELSVPQWPRGPGFNLRSSKKNGT